MQITGLDQRYIGSGSGLHFGSGFYATTDMSKALKYANFNSKAMFKTNAAGVVGVYVKNPSTKILNTDYTFIPEAREVLIKPRMYNDVRIAPIEIDSYSAQPNINKIFNIRSGQNATKEPDYYY